MGRRRRHGTLFGPTLAAILATALVVACYLMFVACSTRQAAAFLTPDEVTLTVPLEDNALSSGAWGGNTIEQQVGVALGLTWYGSPREVRVVSTARPEEEKPLAWNEGLPDDHSPVVYTDDAGDTIVNLNNAAKVGGGTLLIAIAAVIRHLLKRKETTDE